MSEITIRSEIQNHAVADEVSALLAVVRPILSGLLYTLKEDPLCQHRCPVSWFENVYP